MIKKIAIIGMGALGLLYADQLTRGTENTASVEFVMDEERLARHRHDVYTINGEVKRFRVVSCRDATPADLCIVAVKYNALDSALDTMQTVIGPDTVIMSVMNGVTSEKIIGKRYPNAAILLTVAQGMDVMRDGSDVRYTRCGALRIGTDRPDNVSALDSVEELFRRAAVPYFRESDIMYRLWFKYMMNVGINQVCMVFDVGYGIVVTEGTEANRILREAMREVIPVAKAHGVNLTEADIDECIAIEKTLDPLGYPSMAQDRKAGRRSEVEMFSGDLLRMSEEIGVEAPCNRFLYDRVREIEQNFRAW